MSISAAHDDQFKAQTARDGRVYTFTADGEYLVFPVNGNEVIPFWSSRSRIEKLQEDHPKYEPYQIKEMPLSEFMEWLPNLGKDGIRIGTNWSGKRLTGYDVETKDLAAGMKYWIDRLKE
jgi:hypothetical protein